jgi:Calcineurin-like phosphoesterase
LFRVSRGDLLTGGRGALAAALVALVGCGEPPDSLLPPPDDGGADLSSSLPDAGAADGAATGTDAGGIAADYSIVVLPDTQYYAAAFPEIFMEQTRWIVDHHTEQQIAFVLHTGDIVDQDLPEQWDVASHSLHMLDGVVPYVITAGNHDYANLLDRMGMVNFYFPPAGFATTSWFGDTFEPGHIENAFSLITAGTTRWLVIALEFGPRDEALAWANSVLDVFRDRPAIIITHAYLYRDSSRYDQSGPLFQYFNPHSYIPMDQPHSTINDGEEMWQKLILPNRNVKLVFSGHDVNFGDLPPGTSGKLASTRPDGSVVYQILANYQTCTAAPCARSPQGSVVNGGNGYLRIIRFSAATQTIAVSTYSPHLGKSLDDANNQFVLDLN